ncbi:MAG: hypothetical protein ACOYZ7_16925 [Chloroflexota bacterium]
MAEGIYVAPEAAPTPKKNNTLLIVLAVVVGLIVVCCCCALAFFFLGPMLLGPEIGNVFSNIVEGLEMTPVP